MTEKEILREIKQFFDVEELVGPRTYTRYRERSWRFFDLRLLETLLIVRKNLGKPIYINNWYWQDRPGYIPLFDERGLRSNVQDILKDKTNRNKLYLSAHVMGRAVDFDVKGMTAHQVRVWIVNHEHFFPYKLRLEDGVSWVHLDVVYEERNPKIHLFNP
jgi:hypothetical protein